jgi:Rrf2 family protein
MKITFKGDYARKALLELALHYDFGDDKVVPTNRIAKRLDIPSKFLEAVLLNLKKGGFVKSRRGKVGGYYLAEPPDKITIGAIIRFVEGPIEPIACVDDCYKGCKDIETCVIRQVWKKTAYAIASVVDSITLEDLANDARKAHETYDYSI